MIDVRDLSFKNGVAFVSVSGCMDCPFRRTDERTTIYFDANGEEIENRSDYATAYRCSLSREIMVSGSPTASPPEKCPLRLHIISISYPSINSSDIKKILANIK